MPEIILAVFVFVNIILSLVVLLNNPKHATNRLFGIFVIVLTVYLAINTELVLFRDIPTKLFLSRFIIALGALINALVYLFLSTFPRDKITLGKRIAYPLYGITGLLFAAGFTPLIFSNIDVVNNVVTPKPGILMPVFLLHTLILVFGGIVSIFLRFRKSRGIEKNRIRYVLVSFFVLFSLIITLNFLLPVFIKVGFFVPFLPIYILVFNGIVGYAIVRQQLMDIRLLVARAVAYLLLLLGAAVFYAGAVVFVGSTFFGFTATAAQTAFFITVAVVVSLSFHPVQRFLEKATDRLLFKDRYDTDVVLARLSSIMAFTLRLDEISHRLLTELLKELRISRGAFILLNDGQIADVKSEGFTIPPTLVEDDIKALAETRNTLIFETLDEGPLKQIMRSLSVAVVAHLRTEGKQIGLLTLSDKLSGDVYTGQDINLIEILASDAAIAMQNALSYEEIRRFNITLREEVDNATRNLQNANAQLEILDKLKDEFVSVASHELRTPMTAIKSYVWMITNNKAGDITPKTRTYLERVYESTERLIHLVNEMLDVSRIESGRVKLNKTTFDPRSLCDDMQNEFAAKVADAGISLTVRKPDTSPLVTADKEKITQVLENLIGNSIKYSQKGASVTVMLTPAPDMVTFSVSDTGRGISVEDMPRLFKKFGRLEHSLVTVTSESSGLGLYISKQYVELHGGTISVTSDPGHGSTFSFTLPTAGASAALQSHDASVH